MRVTPRPYQRELRAEVEAAWDAGAVDVLAVAPTGSGKTTLFSDVIHDEPGATIAVAHRQELVTQMSLSLARFEVPHRIIGPDSVVKLCVNLHMGEFGRSYYNPSAQCAVAGVDTLIRRGAALCDWCRKVRLWVQDEAHHCSGGNKWCKGRELFPNARGLGVTATPERADGKGLGRHADGIFDAMVSGPGMRDLINMGYLTDYRIFAPLSDLHLDPSSIGSTGDYNSKQLRQAAKKSHIVGDVVEHYLRFAAGKLGVTFATDVETAKEITTQYNARGIPAALVHAGTSDHDRIAVTKQFARGQIKQLVNVDLFGEGYDLPAIEVVSMARPTESYGLYVQQFGRGLRLLEGKDRAIIIDHVGNVVRHGLPDRPRIWTLDRKERRQSSAPTDVIPVRACPECTGVYERAHPLCPYCGHKPEPAIRSGPEHVDGDLLELDAETLAAMRGEVAKVDMDPTQYQSWLMSCGVPQSGVIRNVRGHVARQQAQEQLRSAIAWWAGYRRAEGMGDNEIYRRFYYTFGVDVMTAKTLDTEKAGELMKRVVGV